MSGIDTGIDTQVLRHQGIVLGIRIEGKSRYRESIFRICIDIENPNRLFNYRQHRNTLLKQKTMKQRKLCRLKTMIVKGASAHTEGR